MVETLYAGSDVGILVVNQPNRNVLGKKMRFEASYVIVTVTVEAGARFALVHGAVAAPHVVKSTFILPTYTVAVFPTTVGDVGVPLTRPGSMVVWTCVPTAVS